MKIPEQWTFIRSKVGPNGDPFDAIWYPGYENEWKRFNDWVVQQIWTYTKGSPEIGIWRTRLPGSITSIPKRLKHQAQTAFRNTIQIGINNNLPESKVLDLCNQNWTVLEGRARSEVVSRLSALAAQLKSWYEPFVRPYVISFLIISLLRAIYKYAIKRASVTAGRVKLGARLNKTFPVIAPAAGRAIGAYLKLYRAIRRVLSFRNILGKVLDFIIRPAGVAAKYDIPEVGSVALGVITGFLLTVLLHNVTVYAPEVNSDVKNAALYDPQYEDVRQRVQKFVDKVNDIREDIKRFDPPQDPQRIRNEIESLTLQGADEYVDQIKKQLLAELDTAVKGVTTLGSAQLPDIDELVDATFDPEQIIALLLPDIEKIKEENPGVSDEEAVKRAAELREKDLENLAVQNIQSLVSSIPNNIDSTALESAGEASDEFAKMLQSHSKDKAEYQRIAQQLDIAIPNLPDDIKSDVISVREMVTTVLGALNAK